MPRFVVNPRIKRYANIDQVYCILEHIRIRARKIYDIERTERRDDWKDNTLMGTIIYI